jgi:hypothetical protein
MPGQMRLAGALAAVALAMAISACGSSGGDNATIPPNDAAELTSALDEVQAAVDKGRCAKAEEAAASFVDVVNGLGDTVGTANKEALRSAGENLEKLAQDRQQCVPKTGTTDLSGQQTTTSEPTTTPPPTTETTTSSTTTTTTESPPSNTGGGTGGGGQPSGGPPSGGGGQTGGGGGGSVGGGAGGTGGTGTGGTGGGGGTG